ncbi:MAG TPA: RpiB/LacA/LacB family sugar-phosphate isomerase, partial [Anaerolineales bacterium]|nr:RpiB/LacA/LacB family sugar-phosphate isomerase [Anaerolineales bacterium]
MANPDDAEIHKIVQRVVGQVMGTSAPPPTPSASVSPARTENPGRKVVAIGADHGGYELKEALKPELSGLGFDVNDVGTNSREAVDYP